MVFQILRIAGDAGLKKGPLIQPRPSIGLKSNLHGFAKLALTNTNKTSNEDFMTPSKYQKSIKNFPKKF